MGTGLWARAPYQHLPGWAGDCRRSTACGVSSPRGTWRGLRYRKLIFLLDAVGRGWYDHDGSLKKELGGRHGRRVGGTRPTMAGGSGQRQSGDKSPHSKGGNTLGWHGTFQKRVFFTKRTQLKNAYLFKYECVGGKSELGSFCKKRQKMRCKCWKTAPDGVVFMQKRTQIGVASKAVLP